MTKTVGFRQIIFSLNCFIAAILALFISFSLDLKSPGWAMTTVYLTSQPLSGVMRAKALYRIGGTLVGGIAMVAIVPNLIDAPELTTAAIILWVALCLFISVLDRTPRSYFFALSGYTAALIGFPSVLAPDTVFDTAVSRVEEITIGTLCAAMVHSLIFPRSALAAFGEKLHSVLASARGWLADGLTKEPTPQVDHERRRIAADVTELYILSTSLAFDITPTRPSIASFRAFDRRIVTLLPLLSSIEDRLTALRRLGPLPDNIARALADVHDWVQTKDGDDCQRGQEVRQTCAALMPTIGPDSSWSELIIANLATRLSELVDAWQVCLDLAAYIADPTKTQNNGTEIVPARLALPTRLGLKSLHRDPGMAFLSAVAAAAAMSVCAFFWIATGWPEGGNAVALAAVTCTLFAALDDPTPTMHKLTTWLCLAVPLVTIYQFFIFPAIDGFVLLAAVLGIVLIPAGIALAIPAYSIIGLAAASGFCIELGLQANYTIDLATLLNSNSAFVVGAIIALVLTRLIRVIGVQASARRLVRAGLRDLADLADRRVFWTRDEWASRMLDRVGLLLFRRTGLPKRPQHAFADALSDLRLGVNIIELEAIEPHLTQQGQTAIATMRDGIGAYFRNLAAGRVAPLGTELLRMIDVAIDDALVSGEAPNAGIAAIVGLRRSLYPDAPAYTVTKAET